MSDRNAESIAWVWGEWWQLVKKLITVAFAGRAGPSGPPSNSSRTTLHLGSDDDWSSDILKPQEPQNEPDCGIMALLPITSTCTGLICLGSVASFVRPIKHYGSVNDPICKGACNPTASRSVMRHIIQHETTFLLRNCKQTRGALCPIREDDTYTHSHHCQYFK